MTQEKDNEEVPRNAFLIVNGADVFPLKKSIITIGRMEDNDLVIREVRISRYHAQLRAEKGQYILIDLKSTGGTSVNGEKITQVALFQGDVISLAGIPVIYGLSPAAQIQEEESPEVKARFRRTEQPTKAITDSVELASIDNYLEMFDDPTE
ncbi:MAG TPA: FHA domain-containing protein [Anaerolineales bacterium]|nr:FHA domain-containing protein [Anaerolineales bacterium]